MTNLSIPSSSLGATAGVSPSETSPVHSAVSAVALEAVAAAGGDSLQASGHKRRRPQPDHLLSAEGSNSSSSSGLSSSPAPDRKKISFSPTVTARIYQASSSSCVTAIDSSLKKAVEYVDKTQLVFPLNTSDRAFKWDRDSMEYMPRSPDDPSKISWPRSMKEPASKEAEASSASLWETGLEYRYIFGANAKLQTLTTLLKTSPETVISYESVFFALLNEFSARLIKYDPRLNENFVHALLTLVEQKDESSEELTTFAELIQETLYELQKKISIKETISKELFWDLMSFPRAAPICIYRAEEAPSLVKGYKEWKKEEEKPITLLNYSTDDCRYLVSLGVMVRDTPVFEDFFKIWRRFKT